MGCVVVLGIVLLFLLDSINVYCEILGEFSNKYNGWLLSFCSL